MIVFFYIGMFVMPVIAFLFIVTILRAVKKKVKDRPYKKELVLSGFLFAIITWTIAMLALLAAQ